MKNINKLYISCLALSLGLTITSCEKQLSMPPANARVEGTAITDEKTAQIVLNGVYAQFANVTSNNITSWDLNNTSGGYLSGTLGYGAGSVQDESNDNVQAGSTPGLWAYAYRVVNAANGLIEGIESIDVSKFTGNSRNEKLAEARFLRAYGHFKLLMFFSEWKNLNSENGVLIREEFSSLSKAAKKRSTVKESYDHILADLDFAVANAKATNPNHYASSWAAKVLKMRVLASRGQQADFQTIITLANDVIANSPYQLEAKLKDIFHQKGLSSSEVILGVKPQANQEAYYYILSRAYYPGASSVYAVPPGFIALLEGDPRKDWIVGPTTPYAAYGANKNFYLKYIPFGTAPTQVSETNYAMRLSEVYHLKAEAIIRSNGSLADAKAAIKTVMEKAQVTDFSALDAITTHADLWKFNTKEVLKGFSTEDAVEWYTLIRMPLASVTQIKPTIVRESQFYFPIPQTEFEMNYLFGQQNEGYGI
jgi:starch-binding outer membrane protein, SusD/RagB family